MGGPVLISPSILSGNFMDMSESIGWIEEADADWVHVDVMDGHFVPNITMGVPLVKQLRDSTDKVIDAHLMVSNPESQVSWFIEAGADMITFHLEAADTAQAEKIIRSVHDANKLVGVALKPDLPIDEVTPFIEEVDMVLVMSVFPGFSGQSYIEGTDVRIAQVKELAIAAGVNPYIQVDGGINLDTGREVIEAGADVLVAGNAFFKASDRSSFCRELKAMDH